MIKLLDVFRKIFQRNKKQKEEFLEAMNQADAIITEAVYSNEKEKVLDHIRSLLQPIQRKYLGCRPDLVELNFREVFFNYLKELPSEKLIQPAKNIMTVNLAKDCILPVPWNLDRAKAINKVIMQNDWEQDITNHSIELWLPIGVAFVLGGHHSIAAGVLYSKGNIITDKIFDMKLLYDHFYCDGVDYRRKKDGQKISKVKYFEFAIVFEIGRKMVEKNIS